MNLIKRINFKIKYFFAKRILDINLLRFEIKSTIRGNRKRQEGWGTPVNLHGKEHVHPYITLSCPYSCYYCQNKFYTDKKYIKETHPANLAKELNRLYNFNHLDIQGGEPTTYWNGYGLIELLNGLFNHNIVVFTHNPTSFADKWQEVRRNGNNIMIYATYHALEEERRGRSIKEFINDFQKIPGRLHPVCSAVITRDVQFKNIRAVFAARGINLIQSEGIEPTDHNRVKDMNKSVMCRNSMACISPDLKVYQCPGLMFNGINPKTINEFNWKNEAQRCDHYGLCGPLATAKDCYEIK